MATGENVLYILERTNRHTKEVKTRHVFRTRDAAITAKRERDSVEKAIASPYRWYRKRATWGPEQ